MVQIAEGTLDEATSILQRMRDLAVQAANGSLTSSEQQYLDDEMDKLQSSIDDVINQAKTSNTDLIDGSGKSFTIQSGADASDTMSISTAAMSSTILEVLDADIDLTATSAVTEVSAIDTLNGSGTDLAFATGNVITLTSGSTSYTFTMGSTQTLVAATAGLNTALTNAGAGFSIAADGSTATTLNVTYTTAGQQETLTMSDGTTTVTAAVSQQGVDNASSAITTIDRALAVVAGERASLGATQSQLESTVRNLANVAENTSAAAGRIMDTDYAAETANLTKAQILQQAATSILAQANAQPQAVLSLLQ
jgi:flagellin